MGSAICDTGEMIVSYSKGMFLVMDKGYTYKHEIVKISLIVKFFLSNLLFYPVLS